MGNILILQRFFPFFLLCSLLPLPLLAAEYGPVRQGEMLYKIAGQLLGEQSDETQRNKAMLALISLNPSAFSDPCNINTLQQGARLLAPSILSMQSMQVSELERFIRQQYDASSFGENRSWACQIIADAAADLRQRQKEEGRGVAEIPETKKNLQTVTDHPPSTVAAPLSIGITATASAKVEDSVTQPELSSPQTPLPITNTPPSISKPTLESSLETELIDAPSLIKPELAQREEESLSAASEVTRQRRSQTEIASDNSEDELPAQNISLGNKREITPIQPPALPVAVEPTVEEEGGETQNRSDLMKLEPSNDTLSPIPVDGDNSGLGYATLSWMKVEQLLQGKWQQRTHPDNDAWIEIWPSGHDISDSDYQIMAIISKKSTSYTLAVEKMLEVFAEQRLNLVLTLININTEKDLALDALSYAEQHEVDLLFSLGSQSEEILHTHYQQGIIPVVTCTNKDPVLLGQIASYDGGGKNSNIAYTSLNVPLSVQSQYLRLLKPELAVVALMYNKNHKQVMKTEVGPTRAVFEEEGITVLDVAVEHISTASQTLAEQIPLVIAQMKTIDPELKNSIFWMTSSTAVFSHMTTINNYTGRVPVLASIPNAVGEGDDSAVIAFGIDRRSNAHLASLYAVSILKDGVKPGALKVGVVTPPDISINLRVAKKIGLEIPFRFLENATFVYDYEGRVVRDFGKSVIR
ncbi:MAG: hypothetical protein HQL48_07545 [Gammaproteobacteria bacterium]|nr:hypothetical protein [Gammaproteobacteria bacterium]